MAPAKDLLEKPMCFPEVSFGKISCVEERKGKFFELQEAANELSPLFPLGQMMR